MYYDYFPYNRGDGRASFPLPSAAQVADFSFLPDGRTGSTFYTASGA